MSAQLCLQQDGDAVNVVDLGTFARAWAVHTRKMAWLLGAGSSAAAGVPTAAQILDDLLLRLYAARFGLVRQSLDPTDPAVTTRVRGYFDGANGLPSLNSDSAYSAAFEAAMPDPQTRNAYLRELLGGRQPCYGQRVLGAAIAAGRADLVLTTNFDELIETAAANARVAACDSNAPLLAVAALDSPARAAAAFSTDGWPLLIKLHGDFREKPLKNLNRELQEQDATLRRAVVDGSRRFGLAVAGYSGRDASVTQMLEDASRETDAWPAGLWWLTRDPDRLPRSVVNLLAGASARGVAAHAVRAENFDEVMAALAGQAEFEPPVRAYVDRLRPHSAVGDSPMPSGPPAAPFPVLRLNALPVLAAPRRALTVDVAASLTASDLRTLLRDGRWRGSAVLGAGKVLALGRESDLLQCLRAGRAGRVDINPLADTAESDVMALASEALVRGLARTLSAKASIRSRGNHLRLISVRKDEPDHIGAIRAQLAGAYGEALTGEVPVRFGRNPDGAPRAFAEAIKLRLERAAGGLWLVFTPFTWTEESAEAAAARDQRVAPPADPASDWKRERWVKRKRNERWAAIIDAWARALAPNRPTTTVHVLAKALADQPGTEGGQFALGAITAYSRPT